VRPISKEENIIMHRKFLLIVPIVVSSFALFGFRSPKDGGSGSGGGGHVNLQVFAPKNGDIAGIGARAFILDMVARFQGDLASTGASPELTGPGAHGNAPPFPGSFAPGANVDHFPGLVTLMSSTRIGAGPGQNLSNLFTIIAISNRDDDDKTDVWATWIIGDPNAFGMPGVDVDTRLFLAVVDGTAPDVVQDMNGDGEFDDDDLEDMGFDVISSSREIEFTINGN